MSEMSIQDPSRDISRFCKRITVQNQCFYTLRTLTRNSSIHSHHYRDNGPSRESQECPKVPLRRQNALGG